MAISIDPSSVKTNLTKFATTYPKFYKALNTTNTTYGALNKYWTGDRYKKIMGAWNKTVPDLNKQLKMLASASKVLNGIFKNYTTADTNTVSIAAAEAKNLTTCSISNKKEITFDDAKLSSDLSKISKQLETAKTEATTMQSANKAAKWSDAGGAIDSAKKDIESSLTKIISYLSSLSSDITKALNATSTDFGKAQKSYGK